MDSSYGGSEQGLTTRPAVEISAYSVPDHSVLWKQWLFGLGVALGDSILRENDYGPLVDTRTAPSARHFPAAQTDKWLAYS